MKQVVATTMLAATMPVKQKLPPHLRRMAEEMRVTADFSSWQI